MDSSCSLPPGCRWRIGHFGVDLGDAGFQFGNLFLAFFQVVFFLAESRLFFLLGFQSSLTSDSAALLQLCYLCQYSAEHWTMAAIGVVLFPDSSHNFQHNLRIVPPSDPGSCGRVLLMKYRSWETYNMVPSVTVQGVLQYLLDMISKWFVGSSG